MNDKIERKKYMSVEYRVNITSNIYRNFETILSDIKKKSKVPDYFLILRYTEKNQFLIYDIGSIRGIHITLNHSFIRYWMDIKINAFSSIKDWELFSLLIDHLMAISKIKIYEESEKLITNQDFKTYIEKRYKDEKELSMQILDKLVEEGDSVTLPVFDYDLEIDKDFYIHVKNDENFTEYIFNHLIEKSNRYMYSLRRRTFVVDEQKVSVWYFDNVLIDEVDYIAVYKDIDSKDPIILPWELFISIEGIKYERVPKGQNQNGYYIYDVKQDEIEKLYNRIVKLKNDY